MPAEQPFYLLVVRASSRRLCSTAPDSTKTSELEQSSSICTLDSEDMSAVVALKCETNVRLLKQIISFVQLLVELLDSISPFNISYVPLSFPSPST